MPERIPCINPRCRRTFKPEDCSGEIVCGKCFRTLPEAVRAEHRGYWREIRKWKRRILRSTDEIKIGRMHEIKNGHSRRLGQHWDRVIKPFFLAPEKPAGLDTFLEEMGF